MKWTTTTTTKLLFFPNKYTLRPLIYVEIKLTLYEPWMCRVWWTPCGNYPGRSCGTEVCVSPLQWSHANTTFQHTKQHCSNIPYIVNTQHTEKWKEKSDNTSYLRLFQACTQPRTFFTIFQKFFKFKYLVHNTMFIDTQKKKRETSNKAFWLFSGNMPFFQIFWQSQIYRCHIITVSQPTKFS